MEYDYLGYGYDVVSTPEEYEATLDDNTDIRWSDITLTGIHEKAVRIITDYIKHKKRIKTLPYLGIVDYDNSWDR